MPEKPHQLDYEAREPTPSLLDWSFRAATLLICLAACYFVYQAVKVIFSPSARY